MDAKLSITEREADYNRRYDLLISTVMKLDGVSVTLCDRDGGILSEGHLVIDGYNGRIAERTFHLAMIDRVTIGQAYTVIYIKGE